MPVRKTLEPNTVTKPHEVSRTSINHQPRGTSTNSLQLMLGSSVSLEKKHSQVLRSNKHLEWPGDPQNGDRFPRIQVATCSTTKITNNEDWSLQASTWLGIRYYLSLEFRPREASRSILPVNGVEAHTAREQDPMVLRGASSFISTFKRPLDPLLTVYQASYSLKFSSKHSRSVSNLSWR